jgi:hypothetical protein
MNDWFKNIATKTVNGHKFVLQIQKIYSHDTSTGEIYEDGYDYIISGPNWLSGFLKAQGMNEQEIFEYWDQVTIEDVNDAWDSYYESRSLY